MVRRGFKARGYVFLILLVASVGGCISGRSGTDQRGETTVVTGRVVALPDSQALAGASLVVRGHRGEVTTDSLGQFSIEVPAGGTLVVRHQGYNTRRVPLAGQSSLTVALPPDPKAERVDVGYGSQRKGDVVGSVATVNESDIRNESAHTLQELLRGRVPGVTVYYTASGRMAIRIRGTNSILNNNAPLYVIDGLPVEADADGGISGLNTRDIDTIQILKDASATAIYGTRGANGVILIKTKK